MDPVIKAIFLDLGNTLRFLIKDDLHMAKARQRIVDLIGADEDPDSFCEKLNSRYKKYRDWAFENAAEAPESELWTRWLTPDFPSEKIAPLSTELTYQFRQSNGKRVLVDGGRVVIAELKRRGYQLGIISNLISTKEIPEWLEEDDFNRFFSSVVLSSVLGIRKPDPAIYLQAAQEIGIDPSNCAYVGDNLERDVTGARLAGFGLAVIIKPAEEIKEDQISDHNRPDIIIHDFTQLLDIFCEKVLQND
ncbi:MAG TPA: HAD family hydrolase [Anaerolineales bacterium]|nr:HAD family hydrolase [Anaerolineales bacterium]